MQVMVTHEVEQEELNKSHPCPAETGGARIITAGDLGGERSYF